MYGLQNFLGKNLGKFLIRHGMFCLQSKKNLVMYIFGKMIVALNNVRKKRLLGFLTHSFESNNKIENALKELT